MTGGVLIAIYLLALGAFLGLDIIAKVPPTLYAAMLAGLGALAGVAVVGALRLAAAPASPVGAPAGTPVLAYLAIALAGAAAVSGTMLVARGLGNSGRKKGA